MNKTLIALGVGIWGVMLFLSFILQASLNSLGLTSEQIMSTLLPLTIIEIVAFFITVAGILRD